MAFLRTSGNGGRLHEEDSLSPQLETLRTLNPAIAIGVGIERDLRKDRKLIMMVSMTRGYRMHNYIIPAYIENGSIITKTLSTRGSNLSISLALNLPLVRSRQDKLQFNQYKNE
ncbi:MAG: hypothetical protein ACK4ND_00155 [Cytophagaceae bacterium]